MQAVQQPGAVLEPLAGHEAVVGGQHAAHASLVADAHLDESRGVDGLVLELFQEADHILQAVHRIVRAAEERCLTARQGPHHIARGEGVVDGLDILVGIVEHQLHLVVEEVHVDDSGDAGILLADRIFDRCDLGRAGSHVEDAYRLATGPGVHQLLEDDAGSQVERRLELDDIVHQRREADLYETDHGRTVRRNEGPYLGVLLHILLVEIHHELNPVLHLVDMGEAQLLEAGVDGLGLVLLLELADESGRHQADLVAVVLYQLEVVLLDVNGLVGAYFHTLAAIDALVVVYDGLAAADTDGSRRAGTHTGGATRAQIAVHLQ